MATMKEIARLAGVSVATVSYVLNGSKRLRPETEARVREAMERTGYQPNSVARSLRRNRTGLIGVLAEDVRGLHVTAILDGAGEMLEREGYRTLLCNLRLLDALNNQYERLSRHLDDVKRAMRLMEAARVEGMLYVAMHDRRVEGVRSALPMAFAYATTDDGASDCVVYDNEGGAREATLALVGRGRTRIAVIAGHAASPVVESRMSGFRCAVRESGATEVGAYWGDWSPESGAAGCEALLARRPDAIFAMNDAMAAGCYQALNRRGLRVPQDVSVIGFDGCDFTRLLEPPLTTVALPSREIGRQAAARLTARLRDDARPPETITLPCRLIWRDSVAAPVNAKENG